MANAPLNANASSISLIALAATVALLACPRSAFAADNHNDDDDDDAPPAKPTRRRRLPRAAIQGFCAASSSRK
ncbi:MAG: hypothetical protein U0105_05280 [Candidatus Obscuribacterales bacterium]